MYVRYLDGLSLSALQDHVHSLLFTTGAYKHLHQDKLVETLPS